MRGLPFGRSRCGFACLRASHRQAASGINHVKYLSISAIIVAAGRGNRFGGDLPKQFQTIDGKPLLYHTLNKFERCTSIEEIVVVASKEWMAHVSQEVVERYDLRKVNKIVPGGERRQESVYSGLKALEGAEIVLIHDGVRPFVSISKIEETIAACQEYYAAILAIPPKDTIKMGRSGYVANTLNRDSLWSVQTPQVFKYDLILKAHEKAIEEGKTYTDDAALVEDLDHPIKIVEGEAVNFKITVPFDFKLAEVIIKNSE